MADRERKHVQHSLKKLPIGMESFEEIRKENFYYIDKTGFIRDLLNNWGQVNLFTRPRRFGKTLNMSMLKSYFSLEGDKSVFEGLEIMKEDGMCEEYMGKFPVVSISLKGIQAATYETAYAMAVHTVNEAAEEVQHLLESDHLSLHDKEMYSELLNRKMDEATLFGSLRRLTGLLRKHYGRQVILLIDEYDVPLAKAFENEYYDRMIFLVRSMFEQALKTNDNLQFAVLTGCMRITKESIFTGLNNLKVLSCMDVRFDEYFGFTDREVKELLEYYGLSDYYTAIKEWYDGYQFGNVNVYCPWDVINYCDVLRADGDAQPQNYWSNTSSNDIVKKFLQKADNGTTKKEIENLIAGETIVKAIYQELTYKDMYQSIEHIWSVLLTTGYLTQRGKAEGHHIPLAIPNREVREIFTTQIMDLFKESVGKDGETLEGFCNALQNGDAEGVEKYFTEYLKRTISIRDTYIKRERKENFYHGILLGILGFKERWGVSSNRESGEGYGDILIETDDMETGIVLEIKYAQEGNLEAGCKEALEQIEKRNYEEALRDEGIERILKCGIACFKKRCKVMFSD